MLLTTVEKIMAIDKSLTVEEIPLLEHFIKVATSKIEEYCNRKFIKSDFQDFLEGPTCHYNLKNFPVISVTFLPFAAASSSKSTSDTRGSMVSTPDVLQR